MKINDQLKPSPMQLASTLQAVGANGADKITGATPAQAPTGNVRLSSQGQALANAAGGGAVFDAKKVERIKLAIADGQFQVNAEKVADGLLETARDLLDSRKR